jgi:hypothetical protein
LLLLAPPVHSQSDRTLAPVKSEIQIEGGGSVGNVRFFGYAADRRILPFGFEYDRHSFGGFIGCKVDYVAELLPVVLVNEPAKYGVDGTALTSARQWQYGAGFSPLGARMMWRRPGQIQPYLIGKGGAMYFKNRVLSTEGTHMQFSAEYGVGAEKLVNDKMGFRLAYNDFHFSNGDIGRHNPGIDFMELQAGLTLRLWRH